MTNYNASADAYAQLHAEHKALTKRLEDAKKEIVDLGEGEYTGEYYTVTYKKTAPVRTFDKELASGLLVRYGLSQAQIDEVFACTKLGKSQDRLSIAATALSLAAE